jgi:hypothetical protein
MNKQDNYLMSTYIGYKPNEYIKENLHKYHIFAYPNIWEETFCISAYRSNGSWLIYYYH